MPLRSLRRRWGVRHRPAADSGVTIVVPAHNVGRYLGLCLDSILAQTWWERCRVLVVDDGSTDDTGAIADAYAAKHPRIEVLHQPNRGPGAGAARNAGLDLVHTEFILFLDGDDELTPRAIELLAGGLERERLDLAVGATEQFPAGRTWLWTPYFVPGTARRVRIEDVPLLAHDARTCNKLYRTSWLRRTGLRFAEGIHHQDTVVNVPAMLRAPAFVLIGDVVHRYRKRDEGGSVMDSHFTRLANYVDHLQVIEELAAMLPGIRHGRRPLLQAFIVRSFQGFARRAPGLLPPDELPEFFVRARRVIRRIPPAVIEQATTDADQRVAYVAMLEDNLSGYQDLDDLRLAVGDGGLQVDLPTSTQAHRALLRTGNTRAWLDDLTPASDGVRARLRLRIRGARHLERSLDRIVLRGVLDGQVAFEQPVTVVNDDDEGREHTGFVTLPAPAPGRYQLRLRLITPTGDIQRWVRRPDDASDEHVEWADRQISLELTGDRAVLAVSPRPGANDQPGRVIPG